MNTTNLRENHPKLISHLETNGYHRKYVNRFKHEIRKILHLASIGEISCYADFYRLIEQISVLDTRVRKRKIVGAIERFDLLGHYPDGTNGRAMHLKNSRYKLCADYRVIIDYFIETETRVGRKSNSAIHTQSTATAGFLLALQKLGVFCLSKVTQEDVLKVFTKPDGCVSYRYCCKHRIKSALETCMAEYPDCKKILAFLPAFKKSRKNIQYLTTDEVAKVKNVLFCDSNTISLRDKAIGTLALYMGLRGCDIASLTLDAIDWDEDTISIIQQKTDVPFTLPLTAIVGNAIHDYIEMERPQTSCNYVFIKQIRPFGRLNCSAAINRIAAKIMDEAGIRQEPGDRRGFHIFRHYLATKLLENGTPRPIISSVIGHLSPKSLDTYLSADFKHLKECSISIEGFPVAREVFEV